jgi:hypothetical protein
MSDGKLDGNDGTTKIEKVDEKTVTYEVTNGKVTKFEYTKASEYTATFDGSKWTVKLT